jgi:hypothetical protein
MPCFAVAFRWPRGRFDARISLGAGDTGASRSIYSWFGLALAGRPQQLLRTRNSYYVFFGVFVLAKRFTQGTYLVELIIQGARELPRGFSVCTRRAPFCATPAL